jgi:hypothetical protein
MRPTIAFSPQLRQAGGAQAVVVVGVDVIQLGMVFAVRVNAIKLTIVGATSVAQNRPGRALFD